MQIKHQLCITANTGEHITKDTYSIKKDVVIDVGENAMNANNDARKKLVETIANIRRTFSPESFVNERIADFILERERKIVEPLIESKSFNPRASTFELIEDKDFLEKVFLPLDKIVIRLARISQNSPDLQFIEIENEDGKSISIGEHSIDKDGYILIKIPRIFTNQAIDQQAEVVLGLNRDKLIEYLKTIELENDVAESFTLYNAIGENITFLADAIIYKEAELIEVRK